MRRLFILRPEPGASASVERARTMGLELIAAPLFRIVPVEWQAPDPNAFDGLLLTSANSPRCAGTQLGRLGALPAHVVGEATAAAARRAGLAVASVGDSGVEQLLGSIGPGLRLLHLCGEDRRSVAGAPQRITPLVVYRAEALERPDGLDALGGQVAAVHSPRAAERLSELVPPALRATVRIAAISEAAAAAAGGGWREVEVSQVPNDEALLALALRLCEEEGRQ